jgi:hypothetical protein
MTTSSPLLDIAAPQIVIVANGDTPSAQANNKGHLFEKFVAKLFEAYGCNKPTIKNLNVRSNGYELDLVTQFTLSSKRAIAECKAYSSPLAVGELNIFYSKLCTDRFDHSDTYGWFVAIPGLTKDGHELARKIEKNDSGFKLITAIEIYELVRQKAWITPIQASGSVVISDEAILVTASGVAAIAKQLDPANRLPTRVLVQRSDGTVSQDDINLIAATDYANGLPILDLGVPSAIPAPSQVADIPNLFTVVGSKADFEYQFPAAPEFFVGREDILARIKGITDSAGSQASVIVLNAQSGWGKSSLALRLAYQAEKAGGFSVVFDTRTAASASYVSAALRKALTDAVASGKLSMPPDPSFASLQSTLTTLQAAFSQGKKVPMLIFFDQFENVFRNTRLTQEFRDLALGIREVEAPIFIGFSWKTDLVGLTEGYPFQLRDEIRGAALVLNVEPFGPKEVGTLLGRLGKAAKTKLSTDLRQRLREYSQGLPWLLKKLANHILTQLQAGTSEEELLADALNIERLFEQDLATLEAQEIEAIKMIAREAPVAVADIVERVSPQVIQSLVDQRLVVRVGERLDTYWDTFREFLVSGKVAVEDTYILRQRPLGTSNLLKFLVSCGGEATATDVARGLSTSSNVVFNASRELRQLGILAPKPGSLILAEQLRSGKLTESQVQERVNKALRRHKVFSKLQDLLAASASQKITVDDLAKQMPNLFPAMAAKTNTWRVYALAFASWFDYAGLVQLRGQILCAPSSPSKVRLLGAKEEGRRRTFPQTRPGIAFELLRTKLDSTRVCSLTDSAKQKAITDLQVLGLFDDAGNIRDNTLALLLLDESNGAAVLRELLSKVPGGEAGLKLLQTKADARPEDIGGLIKEAYGLPWASSTVSMAGSTFRAWATHAGINVMKVHRENPGKVVRQPSNLPLFQE